MRGIWSSTHRGLNVKSALLNLQCAILVCAMLYVLCDPAHAQHTKGHRIAVVGAPEEPRFSEMVEGLRSGLDELGYAKPSLVICEVRIARSEEKDAKSIVERLLR